MNRNQIQGNFQTHSLFVSSLLKLNKFDEAEHFIKTHMAKPSNFSKSRKLWDSLIQYICKNKKDPDKALLVLVDCLRNYGVLPSSSTFSSVIHSFVLQGNMSSAIQVLELMDDDNVKYPFCNFVCSSVISGFCRVGKPELAMGFFENCINVGALKPNLVTYSAVVCSFCMLGSVDEVCDLVSKMEKEGLTCDVVFYSSWIYGYFRDGVIMEAIRKHREMVEKGIKDDVISYTILIDGFSREGFVEKAVGFLHKMVSIGLRPNLSTYFAIMLGFCRKGKMDEALKVFKTVQNLGMELDEFVYAILVNGFCLGGNFDRAYALIEEMEKTGITPNIVTYNTLINRLCKAGRTSDADEFSKVIQGDNITYSALLHGYIKEGNSIGVLEVKRRLEEAGIDMDVVTCNTVMKALFMMGDFEDVHVLYKRMQETNVVANSATYCTMIDGYFKAGQIDKAFEIFDEFRHGLGSSVECYNCMINELCQNAMAAMAAEIFVELVEKGLPLDVGICMILIKAILKEASAEGVLNLIYRIENLGLKIDDTTIWNYAIKLLLQRHFFMAASEVCLVAKRKNLVLTSKSYYSIIKGLIGDGKLWASKLILGSFLKEFGLIEPEVSMIILHYLCLKDVNRAFNFLNYLKEKNASVTIPISALRALAKNGSVLDAYKLILDAEDGLPVMDVIDYSIMVDVLCKGGHPIKALDLCVFAERKGIALNVVTYNSVINGLCSQGCLVEAFRLFDSLERIKLIPSEITYSTLIDNLCKEGYFSDAKQLSERMVLKGYKKNIHIYNSFINGYSRFGQFEEALKILEVIKTECLDIEEFTVSSMINGYCQKGDMEGALTFFSEYKQKGVTPDFLGFLCLIRGLFAKGRMEEARSILREMLQSQSALELINTVNTEVETESIESFLVFLCEQGSIKEAVAVLNEVGSMFFPSQKWFGLCEPQELQEFSESEVSSPTSFNAINIEKVGDRYSDFDSCYSEIASLCSSGELGKANRFVKEKLASWGGSC